MAHKYDKACDCPRCAKEQARRAAQSARDPRRKIYCTQTTHAGTLCTRQANADGLCTQHGPAQYPDPIYGQDATKEEQHARYLDSGPAAWDDR